MHRRTQQKDLNRLGSVLTIRIEDSPACRPCFLLQLEMGTSLLASCKEATHELETMRALLKQQLGVIDEGLAITRSVRASLMANPPP